MMKKEISTRRPPGPSSPDSDGPFGALRDAGNLIESGRYDEAARQLARYIDAGVDVALSHFATKAIAELAAARMPEAERTLKPGDPFKECAKDKDCPEMIVVPAGSFRMGSPVTENGHYVDEGPEHNVVLANPIAVSKFLITFADWDACVSAGGCPRY